MRCNSYPKYLIFIYLIFFLLNLQSVYSTFISPGKFVINFEPKKEYSFNVIVGGVPNLAVTGNVGYGIELEIGKLEDFEDGNKYFKLTIKMPESLPIAGDRIEVGGIKASEILGESMSTISTSVNVVAPIYVNVPYPETYVLAYFDVANRNINETLDFYVRLSNKGKLDVDKAYVILDILSFGEFDFDNKVVSLTSDTQKVTSRGETNFHILQNTTGWNPGEYKVIANVYYDSNNTKLDRYFNIGSLNVLITNYTKNVAQGQINQFEVQIESKWNNRINNIYGEVSINGTTFRTPSVELNPWSKEILTGYWDTTNVLPGDYDTLIRVFYSGQTKTEKGVVKVIKKEEKKKLLTTTTILIGVILLLVLIDIVFILIKKRSNKNNRK